MGDNTINIGSITNAVFGTEAGTKPYNMYLCRKLTEALRDYNPNVKEFLNRIKEADKTNWETIPRYYKIAFPNIISSFVGVIGVLLQKLIASGYEASKSNSSKNAKDYLEICIATVQRTLQLLCYSFISKLWDYKKDKNFELTGDQSAILENFFNTYPELNISEYADLLKTLVNIFDEQKIVYPFSEFKNDCLKDESGFIKACKNIEAKSKQDSGQLKLSITDEAERELTEILTTVNFLADYKMVSVNEISYEALRNNKAQYIHSYTLLGTDDDNDTDTQKLYSSKYKYDSLPISSNAVLIFKNKYQEGLNLFPFIIDVNALTGQTEAKICFYTYFEEGKKKLTYSNIAQISSDKNDSSNDLSDPSYVVIQYNKDVEDDMNANTENDITKLKEDSKKYNNLQLNTVYKIFENAKKEILYNSAVNT